jgi:DNA polymerase sigma
MVATYLSLIPMLRPILYFLKFVLKARGLNDPSGQIGVRSLSSYSVVLMVINYFQMKSYLPNLQDFSRIPVEKRRSFYTIARNKRNARGGISSDCVGFDVSFLETEDATKFFQELGMKPEPVAAEVALLGFLEFFSKEFDAEKQIIAVREGKMIDREEPYRDLKGKQDQSPPAPSNLSLDAEGQQLQALEEQSDTLGQNTPSISTSITTPKMYEETSQPKQWASQLLIIQDPFIIPRNTSGNIPAAVAKVILSVRQSHFDGID